jgi:hypothetical protein
MRDCGDRAAEEQRLEHGIGRNERRSSLVRAKNGPNGVQSYKPPSRALIEMTEPKMTLEEARALEDELTGLAGKALEAVLAEKPETIKAMTALTMGLGHLLLVTSVDDAAAETFADEMAKQLKAYVRNERNRRIAQQARAYLHSGDVQH